MAFIWLVEDEGNALLSDGLTFFSGAYSFSPIALLTFGFVAGLQDGWTNCTTPNTVVWTDCPCGS